MTLGDIIRDYRTAHNLSMDKFSELSGISKGYISMLEKNKTARGDEPSPSFDMFKNVAKTIGMEVDDIIRAVEGKISFISEEEKEKSSEVGGLSLEGVSREDIKTIKAYLDMPEDQRRALAKILGVSE